MKSIQFTFFLIFAAISLISLGLQAQTWRSELYPTDWLPIDGGGAPDAQGRFLHDFSYAGYHMGEDAIPSQIGALTDVTQPPYNVDNTGTTDVTTVLQQAIDDIGQAGGGTVYLPAGTYRITTESRNYALLFNRSNVLLKGDGPDQTFLFVDQQDMRLKAALLVSGVGDEIRPNIWNYYSDGNEILMREDHMLPTKTIKLASVTGLVVGDWVVLNTLCNNAWAQEHGLKNEWGNKLDGITYYRKITAVSASDNSIEIDIPTRYYMKTRDQARIYKLTVDPIKEVGLSDFSIGQRQKDGLSSYSFNDYKYSSKPAYYIHGAHLISFSMVVDGWLTHVESYRPSVNTSNVHMPSNGLVLSQSRNVTVANVELSRPQITRIGGGNGYSFTHRGSDNLIVDAVATGSRHSFSAKRMFCSGNVLKNCEVRNGYLEADYHMHFSHANLVENFKGQDFNAVYRAAGTTNHGHTSSENVFWRFQKTSSNNQVRTQQWGWGYVIGADKVSLRDPTKGDTIPDFVEGTGLGATLEPQSLYSDQLTRRLEIPSTPVVEPADAFVRGGSYANQNYGSENEMMVKKASIDYTRQIYLRFPLASLPVGATSAKLRMHTADTGVDVGQTDLEVRFVADDDWNESQITFNNKPLASELLDSRPGQAGTLEWDITDRVLSEKSGDGFISLQLTSTSAGSHKNAFFHSRESTDPSLRPALVVDEGGSTDSGFTTLEDAYVRRGVNSATAYGVSDSMRLLLKNSSNSSLDREVVLKLDLSGATSPINTAKLRLYHSSFHQVNSQTQVSIGVYKASTDTWTEENVTANDIMSSGSASSTINVSAGTVNTYVEWDVTSLVIAEAGGDDIISLVLKGTQTNENTATFHSKENTNVPELIINGSSDSPIAARVLSSKKLLGSEATVYGISPNELSIYPNPFKNRMTLTATDFIHSVEITDLSGKKIHQMRFATQKSVQVIDIGFFKQGVYLLKVTQNSGVSKVFRLIRE